MTIEEKVLALLSADDTVSSLVSPDRIKPPGDWSSLARPYIVHFPIMAYPIYTHSGIAQLKCWKEYQISVFADLYSDARTVCQAIVNALSGQHDEVTFFWNDQREFYEPSVKIHHLMVQFEVHEAL